MFVFKMQTPRKYLSDDKLKPVISDIIWRKTNWCKKSFKSPSGHSAEKPPNPHPTQTVLYLLIFSV